MINVVVLSNDCGELTDDKVSTVKVVMNELIVEEIFVEELTLCVAEVSISLVLVVGCIIDGDDIASGVVVTVDSNEVPSIV